MAGRRVVHFAAFYPLSHGPVDVTPHAVDFDIRLVNEPPITRRAPGKPGRIRQQLRESLHPSVDGDVVDLNTAFDQQLLDIAVRQAVTEWFCMNATPAMITCAVRSVRNPRIGRSRCLRRLWSASIRLLAYCSTWCQAAGTSSSRTRG
jgi:hypothetical protein